MDEAERCHRIACIAYGNLLVKGTVAEVLRSAAFATWAVTGGDLRALAAELRGQPGVEQVVPFGNTLHVSGRDRAALEATIAAHRTPEREWTPIPAGLEDMFIGLMDQAKDNYG